MKKKSLFCLLQLFCAGTFLILPRTTLLGTGNEQVGNAWLLFLLFSTLYGAILPVLSDGDRFLAGIAFAVFFSFSLTAGIMYPAVTLIGTAVYTCLMFSTYLSVSLLRRLWKQRTRT